MTEDLKKFESTLKKKHNIAWTPKYKESFKTNISRSDFILIASIVFGKLNWDIVYQDEHSIEAKCGPDEREWQHKIIARYESGEAKIRSISLGDEFWDNGRNSKRVKLFIYAFKKTEKEIDKDVLLAIEQEAERVKNWDDYDIPSSLPQPKERKEPLLPLLFLGGIAVALSLGFIVAFLSVKGYYIIGLFEGSVAYTIIFSLKYLTKASNYNYTIYDTVKHLPIGMVVLVFVSNQYFQYHIILIENNFEPYGFFEFIKLRLEAGLILESLNTGWIGLVISWIFQLGFTYAFCIYGFNMNLISYQLERVPTEVVQFACYHFVQGKNEYQVRSELSKMGWTQKPDQDEVFESIAAIQGVNEIVRM